MKTVVEWRIEIKDNDCMAFNGSIDRTIEAIQREAYEQGRADVMKWVSAECKRQVEHINSVREQLRP